MNSFTYLMIGVAYGTITAGLSAWWVTRKHYVDMLDRSIWNAHWRDWM